jgi:hypothetical protein
MALGFLKKNNKSPFGQEGNGGKYLPIAIDETRLSPIWNDDEILQRFFSKT